MEEDSKQNKREDEEWMKKKEVSQTILLLHSNSFLIFAHFNLILYLDRRYQKDGRT